MIDLMILTSYQVLTRLHPFRIRRKPIFFFKLFGIPVYTHMNMETPSFKHFSTHLTVAIFSSNLRESNYLNVRLIVITRCYI